MSDISKIKLPSGDIYNIKDIEARSNQLNVFEIDLSDPSKYTVDSQNNIMQVTDSEILATMSEIAELYEAGKVMIKMTLPNTNSGSVNPIAICIATGELITLDMDGTPVPNVMKFDTAGALGNEMLEIVLTPQVYAGSIYMQAQMGALLIGYADISGHFDSLDGQVGQLDTYVRDSLELKADTADLAQVAFSGSYTDLIDTPTVPTNLSDLNDDIGVATMADIPSVPGDLSGFNNDVGFITIDDVPTNLSDFTDDVGYATETYVNNAVGDLVGVKFGGPYNSVSALPATGSGDTIYLVSNSGSGQNTYDEYLWITNKYEKIGTTEVDLTNYALKSELPTKVSDLTNDSGFISGITSSDVTTALGYTPYNSTNPNGYISNVTVTPDYNSGTHLADITVGSTTTSIYTPSNDAVFIMLLETSEGYELPSGYTYASIKALINSGRNVYVGDESDDHLWLSLNAYDKDFLRFSNESILSELNHRLRIIEIYKDNSVSIINAELKTSVTNTLSSGVKIGTIDSFNSTTDLYAPDGIKGVLYLNHDNMTVYHEDTCTNPYTEVPEEGVYIIEHFNKATVTGGEILAGAGSDVHYLDSYFGGLVIGSGITNDKYEYVRASFNLQNGVLKCLGWANATKVSDLTNDSGFITSSDLPGLADANNNGLMSSTQYSRVAQLTDAYINNLIDAKIDAAIAGGY